MKKNNWLLIILTFAFLTRVLFLASPAHEYFDEVYHAFTAKIILHGDPKAWEWWNPHPEGFAYEWTHPPLAKEIMALSMAFWGENAFAWRLPAALAGTVSVYLVYLIGKKLFGDAKVGLLASSIFALDGLVLVMSRIGMNDIYFLVFMLASFFFFIREKHFVSALSLGLAAASKWTVFWFLPILVIAHFALGRKFKKEYLWYLILPPLVYLLSYVPMFLTGHDLGIFWGLQKQMWWYHTGLKATHPYTSPWWSWPILLKPIWLYHEVASSASASGKIANIYALGNPIVFWFGLASVLVAIKWAFTKKMKELGLIIFAYGSFFIPWAVSPRIMFLYHYLPSLPFLAILGGFVLKKYPKLILPFYSLAFLLFLYFYPHWTGMEIPIWLDNSYYWFSNWR